MDAINTLGHLGNSYRGQGPSKYAAPHARKVAYTVAAWLQRAGLPHFSLLTWMTRQPPSHPPPTPEPLTQPAHHQPAANHQPPPGLSHADEGNSTPRLVGIWKARSPLLPLCLQVSGTAPASRGSRRLGCRPFAYELYSFLLKVNFFLRLSSSSLRSKPFFCHALVRVEDSVSGTVQSRVRVSGEGSG